MKDPIDVKREWDERAGRSLDECDATVALWDRQELASLHLKRAGLKREYEDKVRLYDGMIHDQRMKLARHLRYKVGDLVRINAAAELSHVVFRIESIEPGPKWNDKLLDWRIWLKPQFPIDGGKYVDAIPTGSPIDVAIRVNLDNRDVIERIDGEP